MIFRHTGGAGGMAILSRQPVSDVAYEQPVEGWFPGWAVVVQTPAGELQILNVHLHPPLSDRGSVSVQAYYQTQSARRSEIEQLYGTLAADLPTVVMGDFNENDGGRALRFLEQKGFQDALREFDPSTDTWRWRTSLMTVTGRYDHILYSRHLRCFDAQVLEQGASDHLPVLTVLGPAAQ
jgi:endonuclease/exonuclease/phosphatase family metal-dependent hydrolase